MSQPEAAEVWPERAPESLFNGLLHDAAIFPPGDALMPDAVAAYRDWQVSRWSPFIGPFICSLARWDELTAELNDEVPIPLSLTLRGPDEIATAASLVACEPGAQLVSIELPANQEQLPQVPLRRSNHLPPTVITYVELSCGEATGDAVDLLVASGLRLKLRAGGVTEEAFPDEQQLGRVLWRAVRGGLPFKLTAGLHDPVRHHDPATGFEHHGYLNVFLATARALVGASPDEVYACLADQDPERVASRVAAFDAPMARGVRRLFDGFGTCSIAEPINGLVAHELVEDKGQ